MLTAPGSEATLSVTFVYILFGIGIARAWELLGLEGGGPLDLLAGRLGRRQRLADAPGRRPAPDSAQDGE